MFAAFIFELADKSATFRGIGSTGNSMLPASTNQYRLLRVEYGYNRTGRLNSSKYGERNASWLSGR